MNFKYSISLLCETYVSFLYFYSQYIVRRKTKKMRQIFLFIIFIFIASTANAQSIDAVRVEVPSDIDGERFRIETLDSIGMMIFYESQELNRETSKRKWYFGFFDIKLQQKWLKFVDLSDKIEFIKTVRKGNNVYLLFKNINGERFEYGFYEIVKYNILKESFSVISGSIPLNASVAGFDIIGNIACVALNLKHRTSDLVFVNLDNGDVFPVNVNKDNSGLIETVYAAKNTFYIAVKQNRDGRYIHEYIQSYSVDGKLRWELMIKDVDALKYFRDYVFVKNDNNELLVFGSYGIVTGRTLSFKDLDKEDHENQSAGIFFLKIADGKQKVLTYYDFFKLGTIAGILKPTDLKRHKKEDSVNVKKNKQVISASFNLAGPVVEKISGNEYLFSMEAYRPHYKTETRMDYDFYGRPYSNTYNIFSGYDFFDVIVSSFDGNGVMLWSNDLAIEDILTYSRERNSEVFIDDDYLTLAYVNNGNIFSQIIDGQKDIEKSKIKIGTDFAKDQIVEDRFNRITHWYGDYFLIYGYQKIKNRSRNEKASRTVFYVNKIAYK